MPQENLDWSILPQKWSYLKSAAETYGDPRGEWALADAAEQASVEEMNLFIELAKRIRSEDHDALSRWFDQYPITRFPSASRIYYVIRLVDAIVSDKVVPFKPQPGTPVDQHIHDLQQFGSYRLASQRQFAAMFLPDEGPDAKRAIPELKKCIDDADLRVQVQAHYALALLEGDIEAHVGAIQKIRENPGSGKDSNLIAIGAKDAIARLRLSQSSRDHRAFCGGCIRSDLKKLARLLGNVNINAYDPHGQSALLYAIGNDHPEAVEFLLKNHADANQSLSEKRQMIPLHSAVQRGNLEITKLLIAFGADVDAADENGQTAINVVSGIRDQEIRTLLCNVLHRRS